MKRTQSPSFTPCRNVWTTYYKGKTNEDYYWTAKDSVHLKQLMKKIEHKLVSRSMEPTPENIVNSFGMFLNSISDRWILQNLEVAIINSKWNSLYVAATKTSTIGVRDSVEEYLRNKDSKRAI